MAFFELAVADLDSPIEQAGACRGIREQVFVYPEETPPPSLLLTCAGLGLGCP